MIGYEVAINDQSPVVVTSPDVAYVMVHSNCSFGDSIYVGGLDTSRRIVWVDEKLKVGDRIRIKVVEVSEVSPIVKMIYDREELKAKYEQLKAGLEAKGLI
ncbi:hypothetical protein [Bacteroides caecimuris]|uniref:Uncharacterized protein n=1 Tax=Bacteroides caecimuris TaxID=1796613 RepID=A0A4S2DEI1_9BACE|nr:hypothetical protein [Bacteroides caecimuris]TGY40379.1 hypothetical protein E5353_02625 [Bacteroides caecimuris]